MPDYSFRGVDADGRSRDGVLESQSRDQAVRMLRAQGITPVRLDVVSASPIERRQSPVVAPRGAESSLDKWRGRRKGKVNQSDVLGLTSELSIMLRAGLSLDSALRVLVGMSHKEEVARLVAEILEAVKGGAPMSRALAPHRALFGDFYISMVRSGESGGHLGEVFIRLVEHMERVRKLRESVVSATIYPAILLAVAILSLFVMLGFVVPQFETLFKDMGDALPLPTRFIIELGHFFSNHGVFIFLAVLTVAFALHRWASSPSGRARIQARMLRVPVLGVMILKYNVTQFARSLGTLLGNGVPILSALAIAQDTVGNARIREALLTVSPVMKEGGRMADALRSTGLFEPLALNLIRVGEETGRLDTMMMELARILDDHVETAIKRLLTMLEPILILTLGLMIAAIIVSILMGILAVNDLAV